MSVVTARLAVDFLGAQVAALDLGNPPPTAQQALSWSQAYDTGTGAGKADLLWTDTRSIAASSSENIDLAGVLLDPFGAAITFARIKALLIKASANNVNNVLVGGAASNGFVGWVADATDVLVVQPGAFFGFGTSSAAGFPVTPATADLLKIANSGSGSAVRYDIMILGASA